MRYGLVWWRCGDRCRATRVATRGGQVLGFALGGMGMLVALQSRPDGFWLLLLGWFLVGCRERGGGIGGPGARAGRRERAGADVPPADVAPGWWTVQAFLERALREAGGRHRDCPVVDVDGRVPGRPGPLPGGESTLDRAARIERLAENAHADSAEIDRCRSGSMPARTWSVGARRRGEIVGYSWVGCSIRRTVAGSRARSYRRRWRALATWSAEVCRGVRRRLPDMTDSSSGCLPAGGGSLGMWTRARDRHSWGTWVLNGLDGRARR